jgi:spermidine/putrescine-binding protein
MYKEKIVDATTGKETFRDYTKAEIAEVEAEISAKQAEAQTKAEAEATKAAQKAALLQKLGITESEAALLLS